LNGAPAIDSGHLLYGLMWGSDSRAQELFHLREIFPLYCGCPHKFTTIESAPERKPPQLTDDSKRILARSNWEADAMRDYWIDTEHLLLGILDEKTCLAAQHFAKASLTLKNARRMVAENKSSRPDYGFVSPCWGLQSPWERMWFKWRSRKYE
jgi:ATP-dependent Clp protease ATP-binding subunit ClpA